MLLSSHDLDEVERLCTEVTVLRHGSVVYSGCIDALRAQAGRRVWPLQTSHNDQAVLAVVHPRGRGRARGRAVRSRSPRVRPTWTTAPGPGRLRVAVRELLRDRLPFETLYFQLTEDPAPA